MMRRLILVGAALSLVGSLSGCATIATMAIKHVAMKEGMKVAKDAYKNMKGESATAQTSDAAPKERSVVIHSDPPGAPVEVNGRRIGKAPVATIMKLAPDGTVARDYRIKAIPTVPGQNPQECRLVHYRGEPSDRAPASITFHMAEPQSRGTKVVW
jgi:hypothetical protein